MVANIWRNTGADVSLALWFQAATAVLRAVGALEGVFRMALLILDDLIADRTSL
jgi:hypothetical protein